MDLKNKTNDFCEKLCVFFLATTRELENRSLYFAIDCYFSKIKTDGCTFDLFIFFDKPPSSYHKKCLTELKVKYTCIHKINLVSNNIRSSKNIYIKKPRSNFNINRCNLGRSHGINQHFFKTFNKLFKTKYKNFLLLEADTAPITENWYLVCKEYCDQDFTIAGSLYKGPNKKSVLKKSWGKHLNGVALYKNNYKTENLIKNSRIFLINELKNDRLNTNDTIYNCFMNYDVAIYMYAKQSKALRLYKDTDFITNVSTPACTEQSNKEILSVYPQTQILHKKGLYQIQYIWWKKNDKLAFESYKLFKKLLPSSFFEVNSSKNKEIDVIFVSSMKSIISNFKKFYIVSKRTNAPTILLDGDGLFDKAGIERISHKDGKSYIKNVRGNKSLQIYIFDRNKPDIFEFDKLISLTTNKRFIDHHCKF